MHTRENYPVSLYVPNKKPELSGDILIKLVWKSSEKAGRVAPSSRCLSVPCFQPAMGEGFEDYEDMLVAVFEETQKKIAHAYVSEMLATNNGVCNDIPAHLLSPAAVLEYFNATNETLNDKRLSGEKIKEWFESTLNEPLMLRIAETKDWIKEGFNLTEDHMKQLRQSAAGYRATLEKLAAPTPKVDIATAKVLKKAVELVPEDARSNDVVAKQIVKKLDRIINEKVQNASLDLI